MKNILYTIILLSLFLLNLSIDFKYVNAQGTGDNSFGYGLVRCDGVINPKETNRTTLCNLAGLINSINFIITKMIAISVPIVTGLFVYSGYLYLSGEQDKIKLAKNLFKNVVIGFIIMVTAWFVITTLVEYVVDPSIGATSLVK